MWGPKLDQNGVWQVSVFCLYTSRLDIRHLVLQKKQNLGVEGNREVGNDIAREANKVNRHAHFCLGFLFAAVTLTRLLTSLPCAHGFIGL